MPQPQGKSLEPTVHLNGHQIWGQSCWIQPSGESASLKAGRHLRNEGHFSRGGLHSRTSGDTLSNHLNASILADTGEEVHLLTHPLE